MNKCTPNLLSDILHQESHHLNLIWGGWEGGWLEDLGDTLCRSYRRAGRRVSILEHCSSLEKCFYPHYDYLHSTQSFGFSLSAFLIFLSHSAAWIGLTDDFWVVVLGLYASCEECLPRLTWQLRTQGCGWHTFSPVSILFN